MPKKTKAPSRSEIRQYRKAAFAAAFCRLGTASAAFREINPRSRSWHAESVAKEASRLRNDPYVQAEIARIQEDARLDAIASRQEIARTLADIMRGTITQTVIARVRKSDGSTAAQEVEVPPPISQRISAARVLHHMLPEIEPPAPELDDAPDDATVALADRLAALRKKMQK